MIQKPYFPYLLIIVVFMMVLSACAASETPAPTPDMNAIFTQVAETLAMEYTQAALAMPAATNTPEPTFTPLASPTISQPLIITTATVVSHPTLSGATFVPTISATANGCYDAALVTDVTIPAGTKFNPGDTFEKTWRMYQYRYLRLDQRIQVHLCRWQRIWIRHDQSPGEGSGWQHKGYLSANGCSCGLGHRGQ